MIRNFINISLLIEFIQKALSPDLLKIKYRNKNQTNPMFGHCYIATESLYYLMRELLPSEEYFGYKPFYGKDKSGIVHWWLQNGKGNILDPTAEQYTAKGQEPPYENARNGSFLTNQPSKRALVVIGRVSDSIYNTLNAEG